MDGAVEESMLTELLQLARDPAREAELAERVDADIGRFLPEDMTELRMMVSNPDPEQAAGAKAVANALEGAIGRRMENAKKVLEDMINSSVNAERGDIDVRIRKCLKDQDSPLPLLMVLQLNIAQAQNDGDEDKLRAMLHVYTVMNEELEKKVSRVRALVNKLMRMEDANIRANLLRHHLTPMEVAPSSDPDGPPGLMAAMVPPNRLAMGISELVQNVDRSLKAIVGEDEEARFEMIERIRQVAKEARAIIGEVYSEGQMNTFSADLTPAFTALMAYKARLRDQQQAAAAAAAPADSD